MFLPMIDLPPAKYVIFDNFAPKCEARLEKESEWVAQQKECPKNCCVISITGRPCTEQDKGYLDTIPLTNTEVCWKCWVPTGPQ